MNLSEIYLKSLTRFSAAPNLVVAVSGGVDSMALLELATRAPHHNLIVAHFNHQLRGPESDGDESFVREQAAQRNLQFISARGNVRAAAKGISIEMAARKLRHEFLAKLAREHSADILLAHHADDQIELFLMRLLRGIEGPGLAGMRTVSPSLADPNIRILRPLLEISRAEIETFVREEGILFREDSTNVELHADRNRIRHQIIPKLREEAGASFHSALLRHIVATRESAHLARSAARAWLKVERLSPKGIRPRRAGRSDFTKTNNAPFFPSLPDWLRREIIATQLDDAKIPITAQRLDALLKADGARISINPETTVALTPSGHLQIFDNLWPTDSLSLNLTESSQAQFSNVTLSWTFPKIPNLTPLANQMTFDADRVGSKIILRHWRQGDCIHLSGRSSTRPLHEMLSRNKIPRAQRHRLLVATTATGEIFWVERLRITEHFKITPGSKRFLEWRWKRGEHDDVLANRLTA